MELKPITVKTKTVDKMQSKERTYDSQILEFGDQVHFYIMSKTKRDIKNYDHFDLEDIASVKCDNHLYIVTGVGTTDTKTKYPILYTLRIS